MTEYLRFAILGLGGGAVIAALALGVVLEHRASGVVNFAHAAMGMYIAFVYFEFRQSGDLVLPFLGLPARIHLSDHPSTMTAVAVAFVIAVVVGLLVFGLIFRPLRNSPPLARVVASLGLLLYLQEIVRLRFDQGSAVLSLTSLLPSEGVEILGTTIPVDRLWLTAIVLLLTVGLIAIYRYTKFGLVTRAAAENERSALLLGLHTDYVGALNWVGASVLAGGAIILSAPISGLSPINASLLIVPALAAALAGGFRSFGITAAAGIAIGMLQSVTLKLVVDTQPPSWLSGAGLQQAIPFLIIIGIITLRGPSLPGRGLRLTARFPSSPIPKNVFLTTAVGFLLISVGLLTLSSQWRQGIITSTIAAVVCLSIVVLTGYVGQISLAPMAFAGVAGFAVAKLQGELGVPFPLAPILAVGLAVMIGLVAGIPSVRVRGLNLAIVTLAAAMAIQELIFRSTAFVGSTGATEVPNPEFLGINFGISALGAENFRATFGIMALVTLVGAGVVVANLRRSATGIRWLAVRANERAAAAAGVNVARTKLGAFAFSSALAGMGGVLLAYRYQALSVESFTVFASLSLIALTYLGGIASITGALFAGLLIPGGILTSLLDQGGSGSQYQLAISGLALILVAVLYPEGIGGAIRKITATRKAARPVEQLAHSHYY